MRISVVKGVGAYLPERIMLNREFEETLETSNEWIIERTGIEQRHIAAENQVTSDLGAEAAKAALKNAGMNAEDIDLIVLATTTPDDTMPATAVHVQRKLGIHKGAALDVNAACSGFVYALTVADSMLKSGVGNKALVIGAETYSRILNWEDRSTCILFGDGAGALVLEAEESDGDVNARGVHFCELHADGQYAPLLATTGGVSSTKNAGVLFMSGKEIFRHATAKMSESLNHAMAQLKLPVESIDWLVPHQANKRILSVVGQKIGLDEKKLISTVARHANTSAASIPLALAEGVADGRIRPHQLIALTALGAGLTWGSCILRW